MAKMKRTVSDGTEDRLTPFEVAVLSRVVRAHITPEADLVSSWGMGPWAAPALDGLLKRGLVSRREEVSQFIGQEGFPNKPGPWIVPTEAGTTRMPDELDIGFPPSGNWLTYAEVPLNDQPPDLLMQLIEYFFVLNGVMKVNEEADVRPAPVLLAHLLERLSEIKKSDGCRFRRRGLTELGPRVGSGLVSDAWQFVQLTASFRHCPLLCGGWDRTRDKAGI